MSKIHNLFKQFINFMTEAWKNRKLIFDLARNDFKTRYSGSLLGMVWAFIIPLVTICVLWYVFEVGLRQQPAGDVPFILWLVPAYVPWLFFQDAFSQSSNCFYEYSYLVKKVRFRTSILPLVKILSCLFTHVFFIGIIFVIYALYGYPPKLHYFQCIYYSFALIMFLIGLSWAVSAISVFFKDMTQIVSIFIQIGFWICPIIWSPLGFKPLSIFILKINPLYYIIQGYRESFTTTLRLTERINNGIYFWAVTIFLFIFGAFVFQRLRPHFADVL